MYKSLRVGIQRLCNLKDMVMPEIIGAIGIVTKVLKKNLEAMPRKHSIDSLQNAAVLVTSHSYGKYCSPELED